MSPQNYDFGKHWRKKIVPLLDHPHIKTAIRRGVNAFSSRFGLEEKFEDNAAPASYATSDWYLSLMMNKTDMLYDKLKEKKKIPTRILRLEKRDARNPPDDYEGSFLEARDIYIDKNYLQWNNVKHDIESYVIHMACHEWAPTFQLTLARLVEPKENWGVRIGKKHSTIVNENDTKIFDLQYWALTGDRLDGYIFGTPFVENDPTLGGKGAYDQSV